MLVPSTRFGNSPSVRGVATPMREIDAHQLHDLIDAGGPLVLLDVRRPETFPDAHLPGARSAISDDILETAPGLAPDRSTPVVTYCGSDGCRRSLRAAERLETLGYEQVLRFTGGLAEWREAGFPVEAASTPLR